MVKIIPFKAIRPAKDMVHLIASKSVDAYTQAELISKLTNNPHTFLHIIKPDFAEIEKATPGSAEHLKKVRKKYDNYLDAKNLIQDEQPSFYLYQQHKQENTFTGIIGCSSIDDYFSGKIKIHEQTITDREEKLKNYLDTCNFNAEPVLFSYPDDALINKLTNEVIQTKPIYDFSTIDGTQHKLWQINQEDKIKLITQQFQKIAAIYIADGHHRSASSALLGKERRLLNKNYDGTEAFNFYLGAFFPETQLKIYDFNRVVKDLNGLKTNEFLQQLNNSFDIEEKGTTIYKATSLHNFSMYVAGKWYSLTAKKNIINTTDPVGSLDASILTEYILAPILGINDLKTDKRIAFVNGTKGMEELKTQVDSEKMQIAFGLYPVSMQQLKLIADTNNSMPPKSTWVEPKLKSGLVVYSLDAIT